MVLPVHDIDHGLPFAQAPKVLLNNALDTEKHLGCLPADVRSDEDVGRRK